MTTLLEQPQGYIYIYNRLSQCEQPQSCLVNKWARVSQVSQSPYSGVMRGLATKYICSCLSMSWNEPDLWGSTTIYYGKYTTKLGRHLSASSSLCRYITSILYLLSCPIASVAFQLILFRPFDSAVISQLRKWFFSYCDSVPRSLRTKHI